MFVDFMLINYTNNFQNKFKLNSTLQCSRLVKLNSVDILLIALEFR